MRFAAILAVVILATGCGEKDVWQGWVYPDGSNLLIDKAIGEFETLEECRDAALAELEQSRIFEEGQPIEGDYECGLNCKPAGKGLNVCEVTEH